MSAPSRRRPARPRRLPRRVYWFRRTLVLVVLIGLVWGVGSLFGGGDDTQEAASTEERPTEPVPPTATTTMPTRSTEPPHRGRGNNAPGGADKPRVVTASLPTAAGGCLAEDVRLVPGSPAGATSADEVPIALTLSTSASASCRLELGAEALVIAVSTDGTTVWDTGQCPGAVPERTVVLRPGWSVAVTVVWPGVYGDGRCSTRTRNAPPGSYAVEAALYGGEPSRAEFDLRLPEDRPRSEDSAGEDSAGEGSAGEGSAGQGSAGRDSAGGAGSGANGAGQT